GKTVRPRPAGFFRSSRRVAYFRRFQASAILSLSVSAFDRRGGQSGSPSRLGDRNAIALQIGNALLQKFEASTRRSLIPVKRIDNLSPASCTGCESAQHEYL